jgi:hypothetical protein
MRTRGILKKMRLITLEYVVEGTCVADREDRLAASLEGMARRFAASIACAHAMSAATEALLMYNAILAARLLEPVSSLTR